MTDKYNISVGAHSASDNTQWSTSSGGSNDTTAPTVGDKAIFDGNSAGDCTWDIAQINEVDVQTGYLGKVTQSVDFQTDSDFTIDSTAGGAAQEWDLQGLYTLSVGGNYTDIGLGLGVSNKAGSTVKVAGNCNVDRNASATINRYANLIFIGSIADENSVKTRTVDWTSGKAQIDNGTIRNNQTIITTDSFSMGTATIGTGCKIQDDGSVHTVFITGLWTGLNQLTFVSTAVNRLQITLSDLNIIGANFGASQVTLSSNAALKGAWVTTGDWRFRGSTATVSSLEGGASIACRNFQIGNESNTARPCDFTQKTGSTIVASGTALLTADDTIQVSRWTRQVGSIVRIGDLLTVGADSALSWSAVVDNTATELGGFNFASTATVSAANAWLNIVSDGTPVTTNTSNGNRAITVVVASGSTWKTSGNVYVDNVRGPASGTGTMTGTGQILLQTYVNGENIVANGTTPGALTFSWAVAGIKAYDYGNATVTTGVTGSTLVVTGFDFKCYQLDVYRLTQPSTTTLTVSGSINVEVTNLICGNKATRRGRFIWDSAGTLLIKGNVTLNDPDTLDETGITFNAGSGPVTILGNFDAQTLSEVSNLGASLLEFGGNITLSVTATIDWGTTPIRLIGAASQDLSMGGKTISRLVNVKSAGLTRLLQAVVITGEYVSRPTGIISTKFQVGIVFTIANFNLDNRSSIFKETIDSTDGATPVSVTNTQVGPTGRNTDVGRITLAVGTQNMNSETCTDLGGNTNFNFAALPLPKTGGAASQVARSVSKPVTREVAA